MSMDDRQKGFETKYALDQQMMFKIEARASKLVGNWAAGKLGMSAEETATYAREVVASNLDEPGFDDVKRKVMGDFSTAQVTVTEVEFDDALRAALNDARTQIEAEADGSKS